MDLGTVMKIFMKVGSPSFVASRFPSVWKNYFNQGGVRILKSIHHELEIVVEGAEAYRRAGCEGTLGWTAMALEYAGAKDLVAHHHECLFQGGGRCLFDYRWR